MRSNIVILTSGLTGSSVLAGLLARGGYWTGESTQKKKRYNTFENSDLVRLDEQLLASSRFTGNYLLEFSEHALSRLGALPGQIDETPYLEFLKQCDRHRPWMWKDPRLWMTIHFWHHLLDRNDCKFILLTRSFLQCWVSTTTSRQIISYSSFKAYESQIRGSISDFASRNRYSLLEVDYQALILDPDKTLRALNEYLGTELKVSDLAAVYHKPLYKSPRPSVANYFKAGLIYLKNYRERVDRNSVPGAGD